MRRDANNVEAAIVEFVLASPHGVRRGQVAERIGLGKSSTLVHLMMLLRDGTISRAGTGPATVWGPPGIEKRPKRIRSAQYMRDVANRALARRRLAKEAIGLDEWLESPPLRVIVPASQAKPLPKMGAASVWELAA